MTGIVVPFPTLPRSQLVESTNRPLWSALREGGVRHRILYVHTDASGVTLESMCGRRGVGQYVTSGRVCAWCTRLGWRE